MENGFRVTGKALPNIIALNRTIPNIPYNIVDEGGELAGLEVRKTDSRRGLYDLIVEEGYSNVVPCDGSGNWTFYRKRQAIVGRVINRGSPCQEYSFRLINGLDSQLSSE